MWVELRWQFEVTKLQALWRIIKVKGVPSQQVKQANHESQANVNQAQSVLGTWKNGPSYYCKYALEWPFKLQFLVSDKISQLRFSRPKQNLTSKQDGDAHSERYENQSKPFAGVHVFPIRDCGTHSTWRWRLHTNGRHKRYNQPKWAKTPVWAFK